MGKLSCKELSPAKKSEIEDFLGVGEVTVKKLYREIEEDLTICKLEIEKTVRCLGEEGSADGFFADLQSLTFWRRRSEKLIEFQKEITESESAIQVWFRLHELSEEKFVDSFLNKFTKEGDLSGLLKYTNFLTDSQIVRVCHLMGILS